MPEESNETKIALLQQKVQILESGQNKLQNEVREYKGLVEIYQVSNGQIKTKLDQIYTSLIGDEMGNAGMVKRLATLEGLFDNLSNWIERKKFWIAGVFIGGGGVIGVAIWGAEKLFDLIK